MHVHSNCELWLSSSQSLAFELTDKPELTDGLLVVDNMNETCLRAAAANDSDVGFGIGHRGVVAGQRAAQGVATKISRPFCHTAALAMTVELLSDLKEPRT
jgi:hypothetical protein